MDWPKLNSPEDADATHRWARACLEMWETERAELIAERDLYQGRLEKIARDGDSLDCVIEARDILYEARTAASSSKEN